MRYLWSRYVDNPVAKKIAASLRERPAQWQIDSEQRYTLDHEPSGLKLWIANGWAYCAIYAPEKLKLGLIGRTRVWLAAWTWLRKYAPREPRQTAFWRSSGTISKLIDKGDA
ncbi:hypothetical protein OKW37_001057 [Paraburkholderia sp. MM5482-R2]